MYYLKELKKALFEVTHPYFKGLGFKFQAKRPVRYIKKIDNGDYIRFSLIFKTRGFLHQSVPIAISFIEVEKIINRVKSPMWTKNVDPNDLNVTIGDSFSMETKTAMNALELETPTPMLMWGNLIVDYMENQGNAFIEKYSHLPNLLARMDEIRNEGRYWGEFISGSVEHFFRVLIISKLCNDKDFDAKLEWIDSIFYGGEHDLKLWESYYEKLKKEELPYIKPIFNVE